MTGIASSPIGVEALDDPATDPALVVRMLRDIARANRWFGGSATVRAGLDMLLNEFDRGRTLSLFDVGTGAGDLPLDAARWALQRRGVILRPLGLERIPVAARLATGAGVPTTVGCGSALPLGDRSVDLVLVSQVAHHLDDDGIVQLFAECDRVSRRGVIVADLRPSRWAEIAFRIGGTALGMHPMTVADGVTSLRRGFTSGRLVSLAARAQSRPVLFQRRPLARMLVCWRTDQ